VYMDAHVSTLSPIKENTGLNSVCVHASRAGYDKDGYDKKGFNQ